MSATKKSGLLLLCLVLAISGLLGIFTIIDASSARANQSELPRPASNLLQAIIISPTELQAMLYPAELITQTLWITNTGDSPLTYTIYEMSAALGTSGITIEPMAVPVIDPEAQSQVTQQDKAIVIIHLRELPDLSAATMIPDKATRRQYVYNRLLETASHSQKLFQWLVSQGTQPSRLLTANAIAASLNTSQLAIVAKNPLVREITPNRQYNAIIPTSPTSLLQPLLPGLPPVQPDTVEWNIAQIRADDAWSTFGVTGEGAVVGIVDTGVMYTHAALVNSYRGNLGGSFDHNYNWYDFAYGQPAPYDDNGHGSMLTGIVSGDDGGTNHIGTAPGADWIAVKACNSGGSCTEYWLHQALQWMMYPTDLSGSNADPSKAADIVLNGWGGMGCDSEFEVDVWVMRSAGILPVFSPGGNGPACYSMGSPGDLPDALAAGATDQNDSIAPFSSRGPSCHGDTKPDVAAPGVTIRSSSNAGGYETWSSTSLSSAHAAGAVAMILSANPTLSIDEAVDILYTSASCIEDLTCGGTSCPGGANNVYGHGRIDVYKAVSAAIGDLPYINLPWISEEPVSGTIPAGEGIAIEVTFDTNGLDPGTYTGRLGVFSSDPISPSLYVPVTLSVLQPPVGPIIGIDPLSLSASLPVDGILTDPLTISNTGDEILTFTLQEISTTAMPLSPPVELSTPDLFNANAPALVDASVRLQQLFLGEARLIIYLRSLPELAGAYSIPDRVARVQYVYDRLLETATLSDDLYSWLLSKGTEPHRLLTANAIAATLNQAQLETVLSFPQVRRVAINGHAEILQDGPGTWNWMQSVVDPLITVEWNIAKIRADETWSTFGIRGQGAVVGEIDTGVMVDHAALVTSYRGNLGGGNFDHNYNWIDFVTDQPVPYDDGGHGTFGMGIAVGDDGGDNQIGVAPGAKWIAVKACSTGLGCTEEDLHAALQWMLAPTRLDGSDPNPALAPDVVLNMWGSSFYCSDYPFVLDLDTLRAANILPVFAVGGEGPGCGTVAAPAADPDALSAGATDNNDDIGPFSATGPSCFDGGIKPDVVAPGVNIRSSTIDGGYDVWSGTSFSTAHLAGAAALLFSANPGLSLDQLEGILFDTAVCLDNPMYCGGEACPGANNNYGHGRIDVFEAVSATLGLPYDIPWLDESIISGTLEPGENMSIDVTFDASGMQPGTYLGGIRIDSNDPQAPLMVPVSLTVTALCQPISNLNASFAPPIPSVGEVVTFTASASGTLPINYTWDFGDGFTASGIVVTYAFSTMGDHTVTLTTQNACDSQSREVIVPVLAACDPLTNLTSSFTPLTPTLSEVVTFTASATGSLPITYTWDFGDGFTGMGDVVMHAFSTRGDQTVTLTTQNACDSQSSELVVPVEAVCTPPADFDIQITPTTPIVGEVITFTASATGTLPISYTWDFGDGFTTTGEQVTHTFTTAGDLAIVLIVQNSCGAQTLNLVIPVVADCTSLSDLEVGFSPLTPTVGELVTFTASATGSPPISYTWAFGDGSTATGEVVTHNFISVGVNGVSLAVQNPCTSPPLEVEMDVPVEAIIHHYHLPIISK